MNTIQARAAGKKIMLLIDGKSIFYRGYYAMPHLATKDGRPTGGVYGFASLALESIKQIKPDYVAVAWDKRGTNIRRRKQIYDGYKAGRQKAPDDFYEQVPTLMELLEALGWPLYELDDYEADDIMGTLSQQANQQGIHTVLVSSDLDMLQLLDDDTEMYALKKGFSTIEKFDPQAFQDKYGIEVRQFLDLKSLKGDSSDNIPGVLGIGEKTAIRLLQQYETLDGVYQHIDQINDSVRAKLLQGQSSAYMSKQLAKIWCDAPIKLDLKATDINNLNRAKLHQALLDLQFTSLIKRLPDNMRIDNPQQPISMDRVDGDNPKQLGSVKLTSAPRQLADPVVVFVQNDQVYLSDKPKLAYQTTPSRAAELLAKHRVVAHDIKALAKYFLAQGLAVNFQSEYDTKHAGFLIDSLKPLVELSDYLAVRGVANPQPTDYIGAIYNIWSETLDELITKPKLLNLSQTVDFPLQIVLAKMETRGVAIDLTVLEQMSAKLEGEIAKLEQSIWQLSGSQFNLASPKQLSNVLFEQLKLKPTGKRGKSGGYSTGAQQLAKLINEHPIIQLIIDHRELTKLKTTYIDALPKAVGDDGKIHTTLDQDVTSTGRLSSSNPNLQNIPTRSQRGREIKQALVASPGKVIINADYAQFELRLAAAMANDTNMINLFEQADVDIHTMTAAQAYKIDPSEVTPSERNHAKVINFGVLYGMSPHGLAAATDMNFAEAQRFIEEYFAVRQPIQQFLNRTLEQAEQLGYVETLFGRRRPTPDVMATNLMARQAARRAAINMPIQGTEADLMKMAMLKVEEIDGASQIMQVHDSIMVECAPDDAKRVAKKMKDIMENIYPNLGVRLIVDIKVGKNWAEV